jgi:hypothetical protein
MRPTTAQQVDRLVVRDPEQPRAQRDLAIVTPQCLPRLRHRVVHGVVRVLVMSEDRAAVAIQRPMMALVDGGEGGRVAAGGHGAERLVAARAEPARP